MSQTGVLFPAGCFIFVTMSRPAVNLPNLLTSTVEPSPGAQRLQREVDHSPPSSTEVKKTWSFSSNSSNTIMVWSGWPKLSQPSVRNIGLHNGKSKVHSWTDHEDPEWEKRYRSTLFVTSALDGVGGQRHAPATLPPGRTRYPLYRGDWVGLKAGLDRCGKSRPPPGFDPRTEQPIESRYADYDIPAHDIEFHTPLIFPFIYIIIILYFKRGRITFNDLQILVRMSGLVEGYRLLLLPLFSYSLSKN